jgi:hypothetical protein
LWCIGPKIGPRPFNFWCFHITHTHTVGTPLYEWSARRSDSYLHNKYTRRIFLPSAGFEPAVPGIQGLHYNGLDRTATRIVWILWWLYFLGKWKEAVGLGMTEQLHDWICGSKCC